ncbi:MAG: cyclic nucleotide-binding domain-containing protein [Terriglobia bacterium]|jgi:CRP-like cAMP-binding protein
METETLEKILGEHPFFRGMKAQHLRTIVESATVVRFEPGEVIFEEGEPAHRFYLIRTGRVELQLVSYLIEPLTLLTLQEGDLTGWSWLFPPYRWKFTAKALSVTQAISLDGGSLRARCDEDHDLGFELMKRFAQIIDNRVEALSVHLVAVG